MKKSSYTQIQQQIQALQREAEKLKAAEVAEVVAKIKDAIQVYGLTAADLGLASTRARKAIGLKVAARKGKRTSKEAGLVKYRDDAGNTWGGRGPRPRWLRDAIASGKALEDFAA